MNGALIKELRELEKSEELPARVTNRLVLTAVIQLYEKLDQNNKLKPRMSRVEGILGIQTLFLLAAVGWILFGV